MDAFCFVVFKMQFMENFTPAAVGRCCRDLSQARIQGLVLEAPCFAWQSQLSSPDLYTLLAVSSAVSQLLTNKVVYKFMSVRNRNVKMWLSDTLIVLVFCGIQNPAQRQLLMCYMPVALSLYTRTKYSVRFFFLLIKLYVIQLSSVGIFIPLST